MNDQHPDIEWVQKLLLIQESNTDDYSGPSDSRSSFRIARKIGGQAMKRQKTNHIVIPKVHTFRATEVRLSSGQLYQYTHSASRPRLPWKRSRT